MTESDRHDNANRAAEARTSNSGDSFVPAYSPTAASGTDANRDRELQQRVDSLTGIRAVAALLVVALAPLLEEHEVFHGQPRQPASVPMPLRRDCCRWMLNWPSGSLLVMQRP